MARTPSRLGVIASFDDHVGLGEVVGDDGTVHPFHCTAIGDGSRTIDDGTPVSFRLAPGRSGRWEAFELLRR
jgi:cold shock CspA family protein